MIKNVFWDMDGTIIDSSRGVFAGIKYAMKENGYEEPDAAFLNTCIGPPLTNSFMRAGVPAEEVDKLIESYRSIYDAKVIFDCDLYPGIPECLKTLSDHGYALTLASSKNEIACKRILDHFDLSKYFVSIVGATMDSKIETKTDVLEECFRRSPWQSRLETVLIGDTKFDAIGAKEAHITCVGISYGFGTVEELMNAGAVACLASPAEVCKYIEER